MSRKMCAKWIKYVMMICVPTALQVFVVVAQCLNIGVFVFVAMEICIHSMIARISCGINPYEPEAAFKYRIATVCISAFRILCAAFLMFRRLRWCTFDSFDILAIIPFTSLLTVVILLWMISVTIFGGVYGVMMMFRHDVSSIGFEESRIAYAVVSLRYALAVVSVYTSFAYVILPLATKWEVLAVVIDFMMMICAEAVHRYETYVLHPRKSFFMLIACEMIKVSVFSYLLCSQTSLSILVPFMIPHAMFLLIFACARCRRTSVQPEPRV